ncbi:hypothetical protein BABINDRAFT_14364 [Babjeviella inositovora NRRL Y-12698]|uniref:DNA repair protein RAD16 n=1 Tax=Babjeviella inositovora NRRL Y-12698 TaxID=984486 RepID=A0A1E3QP30_9ASCO|nr:uncharacterized protein BABINDRAFT_14364 [Babjeviella inositovora NRRL Y-12698]ODQ78737.1 hypothetical protein BABINDRAFT_14364 [Babjeviella inositovora NRRL Y-12698]
MSDTEGGFIRDDPDVNRRSTRRTRSNVSYTEDDAIHVDEDDVPLAKRRRTPRRRARTEPEEFVVLSDSDVEFVPGQTQAIEVSSESDAELEVIDDPTLSERINDLKDTAREKARKKPKKKAVSKKPRVPYFTRVTEKLYTMHPDLRDVFPALGDQAPIVPEKAPHPVHMTIKMLPFQLEGLNWLVKQEDGMYQGGILADEMGMGKTIQTIALFMNDRAKRPNLVIAPTVALMQWKSEIEAHTGGTMTVGVFHGANRTSDPAALEKFDVVLTTYAVLESAHRKERYGFKRKHGLVKEASALHAVPFYRVVLDEAHNIKDRQSGTAKAANDLTTQKRWCLLGTPLQNRIGEIYSLLRFMKLEPYCQYFCTKCDCRSNNWRFSDRSHCDDCGHTPMLHTNFFNHFMLKNILKHGIQGDGQVSFNNLRVLLKNIMLRRTKVERADDLGLPPRVVEIRRDTFNEEEKDLYSSLYSDSRRRFNDYVAEGVVLNNYANIFTLITRMRQLADHPDLVLKRAGLGLGTVDGVLVCQLCDDEAEEAIESKCHHKFCRMCISEYCESFLGAAKDLECPVCHIGLSIDLQAPAIEVDAEISKKGSIVSRIRMDGEWRSSTKIEALVEELYKLRSDRQTIKSIVFSQFTSMLDLVEWRLKRAGFRTVKLQGSMSPIQREKTIKHFMENPSVEVFLVSLKAGGVALNLCEASQVFIMDPWWNPSVEWQSGDRVHRIGQHRPVKITRFCIEDSIESRIIELQDKKANMIHATINHDDAAVSRLTTADLQFLFNN